MVALVVALVRVPRWIAGALRSLPDDGCRALALVACGSRSMAPAVRFAVGLPDGLQGFCRGFAVSSWAWPLSMIPGVDSWAVSSSRADDGCGGHAPTPGGVYPLGVKRVAKMGFPEWGNCEPLNLPNFGHF